MEVVRRRRATLARGRVRGGVGIVGVALLAALALPGGHVALSAQTVNGVLMDVETNLPIDLGLVMMFTEAGDSVTYTITNQDGFFSVESPEPGSFILLAAALGYKETPAGIFELGDGGLMTVEYRIRPEPLALDELVVSLDRPVFEHQLVRTGFVRRLQRGLGHFITPAQLSESPATSTEQLLAGIPGIRIGNVMAVRQYTLEGETFNESLPRPEMGERVQIRSPGGGWCDPTVFVDGQRVRYDAQGGYTASFLAPLRTLSGVEVYRRPAEVPVEYSIGQVGAGDMGASSDVGACGVLLFWTRQR